MVGWRAALLVCLGRIRGRDRLRKCHQPFTTGSSSADMVIGPARRCRLGGVVELGEELRYAVEERPGDPGVVLARKFYDELIADHPWLAA